MHKTRLFLSIRPYRRARARNQASACSFQCSTAQYRLIAISATINGASQLIAQYGYDPLDRRLWKEQYRTMAGNPLAQAKRSYYLYADEGLIAEASQDISLNADGSVTPFVGLHQLNLVSFLGDTNISRKWGQKMGSGLALLQKFSIIQVWLDH